MKTKSLSILSAVSIGAIFTATSLPIASTNAWSEPLDCGALAKTIEQKLITNGVVHYELSVIAEDDADDGKKIVGACAGGTKKILYFKTKESVVPKIAAQDSSEAQRKAVIKTADKISDIPQFVGTKKELTVDPWTRTKEVWGLTFSPEFEYEIRVRPESEQTGAGKKARATMTEIRYKDSKELKHDTSRVPFSS